MFYFRVADFEFTPECVVFDLLNIHLYHGWLVDPQNIEYKKAIGGQSYNQLVERIIANKDNGELSPEGTSLSVRKSFSLRVVLTYCSIENLNSSKGGLNCVVFIKLS